MSAQSTWADDPDADTHAGHHFTLTVFPDGRVILTTPANLTSDEFERVRAAYQEWADDPEPGPLVIANCVVQMTAVRLREASVIPAEMHVTLRSARA